MSTYTHVLLLLLHMYVRTYTYVYCRLDENMTVKVADFGLARDVYLSDYYVASADKKNPLPVKWFAPEALFERKFTEKSDVVSEIRIC